VKQFTSGFVIQSGIHNNRCYNYYEGLRMKFKLFFSIVALFATALSASGQDQGKALTLNECIEIGLQNNLAMLRAQYDVRSAQSSRLQAIGKFTPLINVGGSYTRADADQVRFRANQIVVSRNNFSYYATARFTVFDGMANIASIDQSLDDLKGAEYKEFQTRQDIVFKVTESYFNVLRNQQLLKVSEENLKRSREQLDKIKAMNEVGSVPLADVYNQQVQVGRDELSVIQAKNNLENSRLDLVYYLGVDMQDVNINDPSIPEDISLSDIQAFRASLPSSEMLLEEAVKKRADVKNAEMAVRSAEKGKTIAWSGYMPVVSFFAQYNWNNIVWRDFLLYDRAFYGLDISWSVFDRFQTQNQIEQADIRLRIAEDTYNETKRLVKVQLRKALNDLEVAEQNLDVTAKNLKATEEDVRLARERYVLGSATILDQIVAEANYTAAQGDRVNAVYNFHIVKKKIMYYLGTLEALLNGD